MVLRITYYSGDLSSGILEIRYSDHPLFRCPNRKKEWVRCASVEGGKPLLPSSLFCNSATWLIFSPALNAFLSPRKQNFSRSLLLTLLTDGCRRSRWCRPHRCRSWRSQQVETFHDRREWNIEGNFLSQRIFEKELCLYKSIGLQKKMKILWSNMSVFYFLQVVFC